LRVAPGAELLEAVMPDTFVQEALLKGASLA
jgi:hypothetical protein